MRHVKLIDPRANSASIGQGVPTTPVVDNPRPTMPMIETPRAGGGMAGGETAGNFSLGAIPGAPTVKQQAGVAKGPDTQEMPEEQEL